METFKLRGKTLDECKRRMRELYGGRAVCFQHCVVRGGGIFGLFTREEVEITGYIPPAMPSPAPDIEKEKQKLLGAAAQITGTDPKMLEILKEVRNIGEKLEENLKSPKEAEHKGITRVADIMELNDFLPVYRKRITDRIKRELPLEVLDDFYELQQKVLEWTGETISVYNEDTKAPARRIIVLVGPTGVGKTTTIAKLGAAYIMGRIGSPEGISREVSFITIDKYRIGAPEQLGGLAAAMDAPFQMADDEDTLKRALALEGGGAITLIDTIGRSPNDVVEIAQMQKLLSVCGSRAEFYLVISAQTKAADIINIIGQFEPFNYKAVIITKLDETRRTGNVISALAEKSKPAAWVTFGQQVHENLARASALRFLTNLEGFEVNRERLEAKFGTQPRRSSQDK